MKRSTLILASLTVVSQLWTGANLRGSPTEQEIFDSLQWKLGPYEASLGSEARIDIPEGFLFADSKDAQSFLELCENPTSGMELGLVGPADLSWFAIFEFDKVGYVKDDEKESLDPEAILQSLRKGNEYANEERRKRGWATMEILGWEYPPAYNEQTHNLEWCVVGRSEEQITANYNTRLLGRRGVMNATLVADQESLESIVPTYAGLLEGFAYEKGRSYAEYKSGDKVAEYGLTALMTGGAVAVAAKTGLLKKFWKLLLFGLLALAGFLKKILGFERKASPQRTSFS